MGNEPMYFLLLSKQIPHVLCTIQVCRREESAGKTKPQESRNLRLVLTSTLFIGCVNTLIADFFFSEHIVSLLQVVLQFVLKFLPFSKQKA